jgi:sarcosine oxidase delta subunit
MGSSREYWEHARECARWAEEAKNKEDQDVLREMAKAWAQIALVESDVARQSTVEMFVAKPAVH